MRAGALLSWRARMRCARVTGSGNLKLKRRRPRALSCHWHCSWCQRDLQETRVFCPELCTNLPVPKLDLPVPNFCCPKVSCPILVFACPKVEFDWGIEPAVRDRFIQARV